jgi:hypothetical protein
LMHLASQGHGSADTQRLASATQGHGRSSSWNWPNPACNSWYSYQYET